MSNQRKQIILNEITFWKKNKLLPERYCNFLMTLYTEGNQEDEKQIGKAKHSIKGQEKRKNKSVVIVFPLLAIILCTLLFTLDSIWLVVIPATILAIGTLIAAFYFAKKNGLLASILYISGALVLFGLSVKLSLTFLPSNNVALYSVLIGNSLFWLLSGVTLKLVYFTISGALGITAIIMYTVVNI